LIQLGFGSHLESTFKVSRSSFILTAGFELFFKRGVKGRDEGGSLRVFQLRRGFRLFPL
jgi:hypothetical protein